MQVKAEQIDFSQTHSFSKMATDYLQSSAVLKPFYAHAPSLEGIIAAIQCRQQANTNRPALVEALTAQYRGFALTPLQEDHLHALLSPNTFTITTAHQPNIFTGPLYFVYKILHAIQLANYLQGQLTTYKFVPVYYMGSEDADLEELGHLYIEGEKLEWDTTQTGAVGRMSTKGLEKIVSSLEGQFSHLPFGKEMINLVKNAYLHHSNVQEATLYLVNELFKNFGLLVVIPDSILLKAQFTEVVKRELREEFSAPLVKKTIEHFKQHYKVQTEGRPINLFYLDEAGQRERIEKEGDRYLVKHLALSFSQSEILQLATERPELFSANVILRPVFQETILPNIVFLGGGGELAYWLELKAVFEAAQTPFPVLLLRNSFLLLPKREQRWLKKANLSIADLFLPEIELLNREANKQFGDRISLDNFEKSIFDIYSQLQQLAGGVDASLQTHVAAIHMQALKNIQVLEKKLKRAARRNLAEQGVAIQQLKKRLFPGGSLQERKENILPFFAQYGPAFLQMLLNNSATLPPAFTCISLPSDTLPSSMEAQDKIPFS